MVWGRDKRAPPGLLDCRRIPVIEAWYRPESIGDNGGGIDCCHWPPKQEAVLRSNADKMNQTPQSVFSHNVYGFTRLFPASIRTTS